MKPAWLKKGTRVLVELTVECVAKHGDLVELRSPRGWKVVVCTVDGPLYVLADRAPRKPRAQRAGAKAKKAKART